MEMEIIMIKKLFQLIIFHLALLGSNLLMMLHKLIFGRFGRKCEVVFLLWGSDDEQY